MSGDPSVRDKTKDAVLQAAAALSYTPNRAASALGKQKQINLALVYSKPSEVYFRDLERGFRRCAEELFDYGLNLHDFTTTEPGWEAQKAILDQLMESDIDDVCASSAATQCDPDESADSCWQPTPVVKESFLSFPTVPIRSKPGNAQKDWKPD